MAGIAIACWIAMSPREPVYQGKTVSQWLEDPGPGIFPGPHDPVVAAIAAMGGDAAPFVLKELKRNRSTLRNRAYEWGHRVLGMRYPPDWMPRPMPNLTASYCLFELGPKAEVIVPDLILMLRDPDDTMQFEAISLLGEIHAHPELAIPAFKEALRQPPEQNRVESAKALAKFGRSAQVALTGIIVMWRGTNDKDDRARLGKAITKIDPEAAAKEGIQ
jgi:hypothetical protein